MRRYFLIYICCAISMLFTAGCTKEENEKLYTSEDGVKVEISRTSAISVENEISQLDAILFSPDGTFVEAFRNLSIENGYCNVFLRYNNLSTLVFLANTTGLVDLDELISSKTSLSALREQIVSVNEENNVTNFMTGELSLDYNNNNKQVTLTRGVVRIDLVKAAETVVYDIKIEGLATKSYLLPNSMTYNSDETYSFNLSSADGNIQSMEGLTYVWEQAKTGNAKVTANVSISGINHVLEQTLPSLSRNKIYTIRIKGTGIDADLDIEESLWMDGDVEDAESSAKVWISESQNLNNVNIKGNDVFVSYLGTSNSSFTLDVENGYIVRQEGGNGEVTLSQTENGDYNVTINSRHRTPGRTAEVVYLNIYSGSENTRLLGNVKIHLEPNPIKANGLMEFDDNFTFDPGTYIDGELGELILPEGYELSVNAPAYTDENTQWLIAEKKEGEDNTFRILAGWRPNDIKAKGEYQNATINITNTADGKTETYYIKRKNQSLPVISVNGIWWCKYNLRGNVKSFDDQVSVAEDIEIQKKGSFAEYLASCTGEEYLDLVGDQYIGGKPDGLKPARDTEGNLYFDGYDSTGAVDFGNMPATQMAPDGYQIPSYNHFRFFSNGENLNIGYNGSYFWNNMQDSWYARVRYDKSILRELKTDNLDYGTVGVYRAYLEFTPSEEWVIFGLGHQYQAGNGNVSPMYILFATSDRVGKSWGMEGYTVEDGRGNWYKFTSHNSGKTRTIRCIKTPVEYMY